MSSRNSVAVAAFVVASACAGADVHPSASAPSFRFQNNFWVNLHHTLRGEARRRQYRAPPLIKTSSLKSEDRGAWMLALDAYVAYTPRDLVFDATLIRINNMLAGMADDVASTRLPPGLDAPARRGLIIAAPIYRAHFWAAQQQLNDRWIAALAPVMAEHAARMAAAIARVYRVEWPAAPMVVDAASEAGPNGAYTTDGPPGTAGHTTIEAANHELQGDMAFEMIFHEASHPIAGKLLFDAVKAEATRQKIEAPADLAHAIIFFTAGELARRELGKPGNAFYKPYAYRYQLYTRGWQKLRDGLERDWLPYLDGKSSWDDALAALVRDAS